MKVKKQERAGNRVKLEIIEEDKVKFEEAKEKVLTRISKEIKIPGFRPGKAPREVVEKNINLEALRNEAMQEAVSELYPQIIIESKIEPVDYPSIKITKEDPLTLEVEVEVYPEVKLGQYKGIKVERQEKESEAAVRDKIIEEAAKDTQVDIPEGMIRREIEVMVDELKFSLSQQKLQLEHYLASIKMDEKKFREQLKPGAIIRVKGKIVLRAVAEKEKMKISEEEFKAEIQNLAKESNKEAEEFKKSLGEGGKLYVEDYLLRRKALDFLVEKAKIQIKAD